MKFRYIKATCLAMVGILFFSVAVFQQDEQTVAEVNREARAGICTELNSEVASYTKTNHLTAGVTDAVGTVLEESVNVAAVSDSGVEATAAGQQEEAGIYGYHNLGIAVVESGNLNVREAPSTDASMVGKMPKNSACEILASEGEWYQIQSGDVSGYVNAEYIVTGEEAAAIAETLIQTVARSSTSTLNVREEPNTECGIVTTIAEGEALEVVEVLDGWIKVNIDSDEGYVSSDYVEVVTELPHAMTMSEARFGVGVSDVRVDLVEYACQFVGNPYVWGGTSLTKGADCSGFVMSVFAHYGISLPHHSGSQASSGKEISASEAKPGDLFFYSNGRRINHVAIYIGGGQVVHASSPRTGIRISSCNYRKPVKVVDIIQD